MRSHTMLGGGSRTVGTFSPRTSNSQITNNVMPKMSGTARPMARVSTMLWPVSMETSRWFSHQANSQNANAIQTSIEMPATVMWPVPPSAPAPCDGRHRPSATRVAAIAAATTSADHIWIVCP